MTSATSEISSYVTRKTRVLQEGYLRRESSALGQLAALRQASGSVGNDPRVWTVLFEGLPPELEGRGDRPSYAEQAIHAAFHLYSHHQQAQSAAMHQQGIGLGHAVGMLAVARSANPPELDAPTIKRLQSAALAQTHMARVRLLRQLVSQMRSESTRSIGLDYGLLAADLYRMQFPNQAQGVRLRWGRQIHQRPNQEITSSKENES